MYRDSRRLDAYFAQPTKSLSWGFLLAQQESLIQKGDLLGALLEELTKPCLAVYRLEG